MEQMFRRTAQQVLEQFGVTKDGLTQAQVEKQRQTYGENALQKKRKKARLLYSWSSLKTFWLLS